TNFFCQLYYRALKDEGLSEQSEEIPASFRVKHCKHFALAANIVTKGGYFHFFYLHKNISFIVGLFNFL
ncbi:MAG: hypothetical protein K6F78_00530, partial [Bacteroidaceae bacterium]|nr:hypothetical protein [Bacteroidaceae bacterium]